MKTNKDLLQVDKNVKAMKYGSVKGVNEGFGAEGQENNLTCDHCGRKIIHFVDVRIDGVMHVVGKSCLDRHNMNERKVFTDAMKAAKLAATSA